MGLFLLIGNLLESPLFCKGKGPCTDKGNYRHISVLSCVCNIVEKEIQTQIVKYFIKHDFISVDQFAFQKNNSTLTCLQCVVDDRLEAINELEIVDIGVLNIQKCFDTISNELLLENYINMALLIRNKMVSKYYFYEK